MAQVQAQAETPTIQNLLEKFRGRTRLLALIRILAREVERLEEENTQLRCAVSMYREALRRSVAVNGAKLSSTA